VLIDEKDFKIMGELQKNCKRSLKKVSRTLKMPITTLYDRIKKLEKENYILGYKAILNPQKIKMDVIAFIFIRISYHYPDEKESLSQRDIAKKISFIPGVQEVHIISGEWDILIKVRGNTIKEIGDVVIDHLRKIKGVERTLTTSVWVTTKESSDIEFQNKL